MPEGAEGFWSHVLAAIGGVFSGGVLMLPVLRKFRDGEAANRLASQAAGAVSIQDYANRLEKEAPQLRQEIWRLQEALNTSDVRYMIGREKYVRLYGFAEQVHGIAARATNKLAKRSGETVEIVPPLPMLEPAQQTNEEIEYNRRNSDQKIALLTEPKAPEKGK